MLAANLNEAELAFIGRCIQGTFHAYEENGSLMVFSSHSWPVHRIMVRTEDAEHFLTEAARNITANAKAD